MSYEAAQTQLIPETHNNSAPAQGLAFDETTGATINATIGNGDFSVFVDVNPAAISEYKWIFHGAANAFGLFINPGSYSIQSSLVGVGDNTVSTGALTVGITSRIGYVKSGSTATYYINGVAAGTTTDSRNYSVATTSLGGASHFFKGILRPIGIYNRALSAAEVLALYQSGAVASADYNTASNTALNTSAWTNSTGFSTFTSANGASLSAISSGVAAAYTNPAFTFSKGSTIRVYYDLVVTSGATPNLRLSNIGVGDASAVATLTAGTGKYVDVVATVASAGAGAVYLLVGSATNFALTNVSVVRPGLLLAPDSAQVGGGLTWYDTSGNAANITLPATGVSWSLPTSGKAFSLSLASTTAGSSNAGALVVQGGLATGAASYFGGAVSVAGNLQVGTASGNEYILKPGDSTATGSLQIQAGGGSGLYGGSTIYYSGAHATRPGWVWVGLGSGSTRKFVVSDLGLGAGSEVFSVNQLGVGIFAGAVTAQGTGTHTFGTTNTVTMTAGAMTQLQAAGNVIQTLAHTSPTSGVYQAWKTNSTTDRAYIGTANQVISGGSIADFAINSVTGNVVLGTASAARLTIGSAGATFAGAVSTAGNITATTASTAFLQLVSTAASGRSWTLQSYSDGSFYITHSAIIDALRCYPTTGNVTVGGNLAVSGTGTSTFAGAVTATQFLNITHTAGQGAAAFTLTTSDSASANGTIRWKDNAGNYEAGIGSNFNIGDPGALEFLNGGTTNMILRSSGNLGIGTTSPTARLTVQGASYTPTLGLHALPASGNAATRNWAIQANFYTYGDFGFMQSTAKDGDPIAAGAARLYIDNAGRVGIGTTVPVANFHIVPSTPTGIGSLPSGVTAISDSSTNNYLLFRNTADNGTYSGIAFQDNNVGGYVVFGNAGGGGDQIYIAGYGGGQLQYGAADSIAPASRTTAASWSSSGFTVNGALNVVSNNALIFSSYGGGWYMSDSSWIRSYGGKNIYHDSGQMRTDGTLQVGGSGNTLNVANDGNFAYRTSVLFANTAGNVGIGTASPGSKLDVNGSLILTGDFGFSADQTARLIWGRANGGAIRIRSNSAAASDRNVQFGNADNNGAFSSYMTVADGGNVGIGTTSPTAKLTTHYTGIYDSGTTRFVDITGDFTGTGAATTPNAGAFTGIRMGNITNGKYAMIGAVSEDYLGFSRLNGLSFWTSPQDTAPIERVRISSSGNVGIATTAPGEKLTIKSGNIKLYSVQNVADTYRYIGTEYDSGNGNNKAEIRFAIDGSDTNTRLSFHTANGGGTLTERMRITSAGNVGIGTMTPGGNLEVTTAGTGTWNRFVVTATSLWGDAAQYVTIGAGGASGIMMFNPHVVWQAGSASAGLRMGRSGGVSGGAYYDIGTRVSDAWSIQKNASETGLFYINSAGNVGIGTTSPSQKLDVSSTTAGAQNIAITKANSGTGNENSGNLYFDNYGPAALARNANVELGSIYFRSSQPSSAAIQNSARIQAIADGAQTGGNTQAALTFAVVPNGSTLVEAMRISSAGIVTISNTNASSSAITGALQVAGGIGVAGASFFGGSETYFQGSTGNTNLISTRAGTSNGATFQYKTGATLKWYHGLRGLVNDNFYIHNHSTDVSVLVLNVATNAATFAGTVSASNLSGTNTGDQTNISGNAATATNVAYSGLTGTVPTWNQSTTGSAAFLNSSNYINRTGSAGSTSVNFQNTPAGSKRYQGDDASVADSPGGTWWHYEHMRHSNSGNYWGTTVAWGWEDNANKLAVRNVSNGGFGSWVYYLNSTNYNSYSPTLTGTGASGTWGVSISGNAATATTASNLSGLTLSSSGAPAAPDNVTQNQIGYNNSVSLFGQTDGGLYSSAYSSTWIHQIYGDFRTGQVAVRGKNSGTWQAWRTLLDSSNYTSYAPSFTGTGASGTWGINVTGSSASCTGNAATASAVAWGNVSSKPTTISGFGITNAVTQMDGTRDSTNYNSRLTSGLYNAESAPANCPGVGYAQLLVAKGADTGWQLAGGYANNTIYTRGWHSNGTFYQWYALLSEGNYNSYAPTLTGTGASGTWGINVTGTAAGETLATVTARGNVATGNVMVPAGNGYGYSFWGDATNYKIMMSNAADAVYGPVTDYSLKLVMGSGVGRGITFGQAGVAPVAAINTTSGNMQIAGNFAVSGTGSSTFAGAVTISSSTNSGTSSTGALVVTGGIGAGGGIVAAGDVSGYGVIASSALGGGFYLAPSLASAPVGSLTHSSNTISLVASTGKPLVFSANATEAMRITTAGNVGIGTTSPVANLDVRRTAGDGSGPVAWFSTLNSNSGYFPTDVVPILTLERRAYRADGNAGVVPYGGLSLDFRLTDQQMMASPAVLGGQIVVQNTYGQNSNAQPRMVFRTGNGGTMADSLTITSAGNVGIGTTSPTHKLHLSTGFLATSFGMGYTPSSWARGYGGVIMAGSANSDGTGWSYGGRIVEVDEGDGLNMAFDVNYTNSWTNNAMVISGRSGKQGNVGIGTTSPSAKLHIVGEIIRQENSSTTFWGTDATGTYIRTFGGDTLRVLRASGGETVRFISNGNVGVGTTSPTSKLAVIGLTNAYATANGSYTGGGLGHSGWGGIPSFNGYSNLPGAGFGSLYNAGVGGYNYGDNPGGAAGGNFFGGPGSYTSGGGAALYALGGDGGYYASAGVGIYAKGGAHGTWAVSGQEGGRARASAGYFDGDLTVVNGNIILGTVDTTGLTGSNGLKVTSTTASSSTTTGAVIVAGGIGVVAASFFGATVATGALTVTGAITATGNITAYFSDDRLKTRLGPITDPIAKIKALTGFYFEPNQTAQRLGYEKKTDVGVSAQEVQAILPEIIAPAPIDPQYMTVRYEKLIPLLIEAIKAQQRQIEELQLLVQAA